MKTLPDMYPKVKPAKAPKNSTEKQFFEFADAQGWVVTKKGWPDYACFLPAENNRFLVVEIKSLRSHKLRAWQWKVLEALTSCGVESYRWSPETGFTKMASPTKYPAATDKHIGLQISPTARDDILTLIRLALSNGVINEADLQKCVEHATFLSTNKG